MLARQAAVEKPGQLLRASELVGANPTAGSKALSRLVKEGVFQRVSKGIYYAPVQTPLGPSRPSEADLTAKILEGRTRPGGSSAANLLGLSTQVPARLELVAVSSRRPASSVQVTLKLRRKPWPRPLEPWQGALLEVIRDRGKFIDGDFDQAMDRLRHVLEPHSGSEKISVLAEAALQEPPRVRAILGALLSWLGLPKAQWSPLKDALNPLSRFDFGFFRSLENAKEWQAK